jgi:diaminopimelate decarboxylase
MLLDVATGGELHVALAAGVPASACTLHGNNKSAPNCARRSRPGAHIVVDSFDELDRLDALAADGVGPVPRRRAAHHARRARPHPRVHRHRPGRLEVRLQPRQRRRAARRRPRPAFDGVELVGVHCHIGSNVFEASSFAKAAEVMADFAVPLDLPELSSVAGSAWPTSRARRLPTITQWGSVLLDACEALGVRSRVSVEPGGRSSPRRR